MASLQKSSHKEISDKEKSLTKEKVEDFLRNKWEYAQDIRDTDLYTICYFYKFFGIKRTITGGKYEYDYNRWIIDRVNMIKSATGLNITIKNLEININNNNIAIANFYQYYHSRNYADYGHKVIKIRHEGNNLKIIYEEMLWSKRLN